MPVGGNQVRSREEVMNVLLADCINDGGMSAEAENVQYDARGNRALPDVVVSFQGLRCSVEGKWSDVPRARETVANQAKERITNGIAHIALAVVYPVSLRSIRHTAKKQALINAGLDYRVFTERAEDGWREGNVAAILDDLRRSQEMLANDDVVMKAVEELRQGMDGLIHVLAGNPAKCERLAEILSVYEPGEPDDDEE